MCDKAWGRPGFVKVLIDVWAVGDLKRELDVIIPSINGSEEAKVRIGVEYLWEPIQCAHCLVFGHKTTSCANHVVPKPATGKDPKADNEGFVKVQKKQWRPKVANNRVSGTAEVLTSNVKKPSVQNQVKTVEVLPTKGTGDKLVNDDNPQVLGGQLVEDQQTGDGGLLKDAGPCMDGVSATPLADSVVHSFISSKLPIRGILKNSNRFSVLGGLEKGNVGNSTEQRQSDESAHRKEKGSSSNALEAWIPPTPTFK